LCSDFIGTCQSSNGCASDQDCDGGALCTQYDSCPGVPVRDFTCQTAADECETNADCTDPQQQFCSIEGDHRACVGFRCAAAGSQ
jgi:hypothetical protein